MKIAGAVAAMEPVKGSATEHELFTVSRRNIVKCQAASRPALDRGHHVHPLLTMNRARLTSRADPAKRRQEREAAEETPCRTL